MVCGKHLLNYYLASSDRYCDDEVFTLPDVDVAILAAADTEANTNHPPSSVRAGLHLSP